MSKVETFGIDVTRGSPTLKCHITCLCTRYILCHGGWSHIVDRDNDVRKHSGAVQVDKLMAG